MSDLIERRAAIDAINHICPVDTEYDCTLLDRVDVRCVLSDLPSAQPEPCGDAVSRTDVFNAVRGEERGGYVDETVECMLKVMSDLPPVTPEQKTGEWKIECKSGEIGALNLRYKVYECPFCGWDNALVIPRNFCPNCGAKMKEGDQK